MYICTFRYKLFIIKTLTKQKYSITLKTQAVLDFYNFWIIN